MDSNKKAILDNILSVYKDSSIEKIKKRKYYVNIVLEKIMNDNEYKRNFETQLDWLGYIPPKIIAYYWSKKIGSHVISNFNFIQSFDSKDQIITAILDEEEHIKNIENKLSLKNK